MNRLSVLLIACLILPVLLSATPVNKADIAQRMFAARVFTASGSILWAKGSTQADYYEERYTSLTINPQVGYFIAPNFMLGGGISYSDEDFSYNYQNQGWNDMNWSTTSLQLFMRYYFANSGMIVVPFCGAGIAHASYENGNPDRLNFEFTGGASIPLMEHFALEPKLSYTIVDEDAEYINSYTILQIAVGIGTYWY